MTTISQHYGITGSQGTFDFIDVNVVGDVPLYIDPSVIASIESPWANECTYLVQSFFQTVIEDLRDGRTQKARNNLSNLGEDNSTRLGNSASSRGAGVGPGLAERFFNELTTSRAVTTGLIENLEDTALLIENVREDRISDVTTNIIRRKLIEYTQQTAEYYGIPLEPNLAMEYWDGHHLQWKQGTFDLPMPGGDPLLLVPKAVVRRTLSVNPSEYYRHYVLEYFREDELSHMSPLTYLLKSGRRTVLKKDVEAKYRHKHDIGSPGIEKRVNLDATERDPNLIKEYKHVKRTNPPGAIDHSEIEKATGGLEPDLDALLAAATAIPAGQAGADAYEKAIEALLTALFHPVLVCPIRQTSIHEGRKRIDITYTNMARSGFFEWLARHHPSANVMVECKNYTRNLGNPEFDQISGRFSPSRGKYGLLVYRECDDKDKILASLRDTAKDDRGFVTPIDDADLACLVSEAHTDEGCAAIGGLLHRRFNQLVN